MINYGDSKLPWRTGDEAVPGSAAGIESGSLQQSAAELRELEDQACTDLGLREHLWIGLLCDCCR